jgi:hypothetical protein
MPRDDRDPEEAPREPDEEREEREERERFVKDVLTRGEAAAEGEELKPGQTHEIVEEDGEVRLRRRRFSLTDAPVVPKR